MARPAAAHGKTRMVRIPVDLADKLVVLSLLDGSRSSAAVVDRLLRGAVEAEFSTLPASVQRLARRRKAVTP